MNRRSVRRIAGRLGVVVLTAIVATAAPAAGARAATSPFTDIAGTRFERDIDWLFAEGITVGCTPTTYCPDRSVTRGEMASFLVRMFHLPATTTDYFTDDTGTTHEQDINRLAAAEITMGCTPTTFCPKALVRRDEMASFLTRAVPLVDGAGDNYFRDDDGTTHEADIDRAAAAGITGGCGTWLYCLHEAVTRGAMAAFLHRVEAPIAPPPHPAPSGPLYVSTGGSDAAANTCRVKATACRTIAYALTQTFAGDTINIGPGTFHEEDLTIAKDLSIVGDPGGGTMIDATGGALHRVIRIAPSGFAVTLSHLRITGGSASSGGGIFEELGTLTITDSTITGNTATNADGGGIANQGGTVTITHSTISANSAKQYGGGVANRGTLTIVDSVLKGNTATIGGGISNDSGGYHLSMSRTTIDGNHAATGGGIFSVDSWVLDIADSTVSRNTSTGSGGGFQLDAQGASITNSTISANSAKSGGAIASAGAAHLQLTNSTVSSNTADTTGGFAGGDPFYPSSLDLRNSIFAGNAGGETTGVDITKLASILGVPAGLTIGDILDAAGLADHGGPTQTIALIDQAANPAKGKGDAATCAAAPVDGLDQRGLPRTPPCDIGAYELQP
jgi:hypothetical protein